MDAREIWYGNSTKAGIARLALTPLSWLYAAGWQAYLGIYRAGLKSPQEPHRPILCVGNLMIGGTGKSPMTVYLAGLLQRMGREVVLSASGYGSPRAEGATLAPQGPLSAREWGDEPAMLRWLLPNVPIIVGRRRVLAAKICHQHHPSAVMLMDDGFQHLPLRKHLSIILDSEEPANHRCLPAGPYREPRSNRKRADVVLPRDHRIERRSWIADPDGNPVEVEDSGFSVLCALGQPERFLASLPRASATMLLPDHDPLTAGTLFGRLPKDLPIVVTAKDWVKLRERADVADHRILIAHQAVWIEPEEAFSKWLEVRLNETQAAKGTAQ